MLSPDSESDHNPEVGPSTWARDYDLPVQLPQLLPDDGHSLLPTPPQAAKDNFVIESSIGLDTERPLDISSLPPNPRAEAAEFRAPPPEIIIDFAPPSAQASFDENALSPPDRSRSRNRIRARSDEFGALTSQRSTSDRIRAHSESALLQRNYILDLADPRRLASVPEGEEPKTRRSPKHVATFQCTLCPKRFTRAYNLRSHLRTHTDERPFVCSVCGKAYARQHDRKRHEGLHSGEKKFVCRGDLKDGNNWGCGRRFARADALGRHFRSEAGRICLRPLLEEEAEMLAESLGSDIPGASNNLVGSSSAPSENPGHQHQKKRKIDSTGAMAPPPPPRGQPSSSSWSTHPPGQYNLPSALLAQYPALNSIQWDQLPSGPPDEFNDSGYSGSSSFDASGGEYYEEEIYDSAALLNKQVPVQQQTLQPDTILNDRTPWEAEQGRIISQDTASAQVQSEDTYTNLEDSKRPITRSNRLFSPKDQGANANSQDVQTAGKSEENAVAGEHTTRIFDDRGSVDVGGASSTTPPSNGPVNFRFAHYDPSTPRTAYSQPRPASYPATSRPSHQGGPLRSQYAPGYGGPSPYQGGGPVPPPGRFQAPLPPPSNMSPYPPLKIHQYGKQTGGQPILTANLAPLPPRSEPPRTSVEPPPPLIQESKFGSSTPDQVTVEPVPQPLPSDSGYHSGIGTDTESVCSLGSVGSSLGLPQNFLQEFIAFFGDVLIERAGARAWAGYALAHHSSDNIERQLNILLKRYTEKLATIASDSGSRVMARVAPAATRGTGDAEVATQPLQPTRKDSQILEGATKLIRRYRPKIARYFCDNAISEPVTEDSLTTRLQSLSRQLSLTEKLGLLDKTVPSTQDPTETTNDIPTDDEVDELFADIEGIRELLVSSEAFEHLAADLRHALYNGHENAIYRIESTMLEGLANSATSANVHTALFLADWSLPSFLTSQYEDEVPQIGKVVTLSGSALYAQATTCLEYANTVWPSSGSDFVAAMEAMLRNAKDGRCTWYADYKGLHWSFSREPCHKDDEAISSMRVSAKGPIRMLVDLAQQLAWIGSAMSSSPYEEQLAYCRPVLESQSSAPCQTFKLSFEHQPLHPTENACWLPMFCGASIAYGFPIPERGEETGLEIPLALMTGIAGIQHAVEHEGGVVMKGFSTIFVPTKKTGNRVQWHLISSGDADVRLSYQEGLKRCTNRLSTKELSLAELTKCRAIVGWCTSAASLLGSSSANYENIDYSGAEDADTPLKFAGGTLGFQQFGVAQLDFRLGAKDGKSHFQRSGPFQRIISAASRTPVVLFDTSERRAWLVPASNVMLHIAQHRHWLEPFEVDGKRVDLIAESADSSSAKEVLLKNAAMNLSDYETYTFKHLILNIWSVLEFLIDQNVIRERSTPGASVKGTLRESISGFEFKAVVEERSPFRQKQVLIRKTCGGWPMLARDIDALVLFANGFEDLIRPRTDDTKGLCNLWRSVPKWKDYLATSINTVKDLYDVAGCRLDRKYLTSTRLQWHRGNSVVFEACQFPGAYRCRCNRLQQIVPKSAIGTIVPPGQLVDNGAIIFGHSGSVIQDVVSKTAPPVQVKNGLYSTPNVSLTPIIVRPDSDDSSSVTSDDEPAGRSGSDTTLESFPSSNTSFASREGVTSTLDDLKIDTNDTPCTRKRSREFNEASGPFDDMRQTAFSETTPKRAKYRQYLHPDPQSLSDEDEEFAMRPVAETISSERGLRKIDSSRHLRHDSGA